jgi:hypothetical protein
VPALAAAETYSNVPVVDVNCSRKAAADPDSHTRACAMKCEARGFGILTRDNRAPILFRSILLTNGAPPKKH